MHGIEPSRPLSDEVRAYYDANSSRFERYGEAGTAFHRAVWAPGIGTLEQAVRYVDNRILDEVRALSGTPLVLDLGCGIGATLLHLATRTPMVGEGITISPVQAARAQKLVEAAKLADRIHCREATYLDLPRDLCDIDLAYSIEAFVHTPDAARYFSEAARVLRPGGKLIVCDDFLAAPRARAKSAREQRWIEDFRAGWHVGSLVDVEEARRLGRAAGLELVGDEDLTPHLELDRWRDRALRLVAALVAHSRIRTKYWDSQIGGAALQRALGSGALSYRLLTLVRS